MAVFKATQVPPVPRRAADDGADTAPPVLWRARTCFRRRRPNATATVSEGGGSAPEQPCPTPRGPACFDTGRPPTTRTSRRGGHVSDGPRGARGAGKRAQRQPAGDNRGGRPPASNEGRRPAGPGHRIRAGPRAPPIRQAPPPATTLHAAAERDAHQRCAAHRGPLPPQARFARARAIFVYGAGALTEAQEESDSTVLGHKPVPSANTALFQDIRGGLWQAASNNPHDATKGEARPGHRKSTLTLR